MKRFKFKLAHKAVLKKRPKFRRSGKVYPISVLQEAVKEYNKKKPGKTKLKVTKDGIVAFGELPQPVFMPGWKMESPFIAMVAK